MVELATTTTEYRVQRGDLRSIAPATTTVSITAGQILVRIDAFAFTANNITYAAFGDEMAYWQFFPTEAGSGIVPVWGFAEVVVSHSTDIAVGERLYGYWPMASHALLVPGRIGARSFVDANAHRAALPPVYNMYLRWSSLGRGDDERAYMLFRPLFVTSFLIDDFLAEERFFGADTIILISASSKTALGLAQALKARTDGPQVTGLTSARNAAFVESTGYYHRVMRYDDLDPLDTLGKTVIVDFAGDGTLRAALHDRLGDRLVYDCVVGGTHWEDRGVQQVLPGPKPIFFFAPSQIVKRIEQWGQERFDATLDARWDDFLASTTAWLRYDEASGSDAIIAAYHAVLEGKTEPATGHICRPT